MNKQVITIIILIFLVSFLYRLWDIDRPKYSPDEFAHVGMGMKYWYNILNLDFSSDSWKKYNEQPPIGRYIYGFVNGGYYYYFKERGLTSLKLTYEEGKEFLLAKKDFVPSKIVSAIMGSLTVAITFLIGLKFFNLRTAIISSLILAFLPLFISYTKIATLESPMVFFFTLSIYLFLLALKKNKSLKFYLPAIIVTGLAIGTKFNNLSLLILLPLIFLLYKKFKIKGKNDLIILTSVILLPVVIFFATFPWLWSSPIENLSVSIQQSSEIASLYKEYFLGNLVQTSPAYYFLIYFFVTTPIVLLVLFLTAVYKGIRGRNFYEHVILLWFFIPLIFQSLIPLKAHGIRYILMVLPAVAILSGIGLVYLVDKFKIKKDVLILISAIVIVYIIIQSVIIHPYYLDYYNELTGGTKNILEHKTFQVGSWGEGVSEATDYLNVNARNGSTVQFLVGPPTHIIPEVRNDLVIIPGPEENITYKFYEEMVDYNSDYIVLNNYFIWYFSNITENVTSLYDEIYVVKAGGAPITTIYQHK